MDFVIASGRLIRKLIAGKIEDFQTFVMILLIKRLQSLVLRSEAAARGGVYDEDNLSFESGEVKSPPFLVFTL